MLIYYLKKTMKKNKNLFNKNRKRYIISISENFLILIKCNT